MTFRQEVKDHLLRVKRAGCSRCGERHPACLDFHHRDPTGKEFTVADFLKRHQPRFSDLLDELKKCDILCRNCHAREHYQP
jgi:hypothetical protein